CIESLNRQALPCIVEIECDESSCLINGAIGQRCFRRKTAIDLRTSITAQIESFIAEASHIRKRIRTRRNRLCFQGFDWRSIRRDFRWYDAAQIIFHWQDIDNVDAPAFIEK